MPSAFFTYFMCCIQEELLKGFLYITFFFFKKILYSFLKFECFRKISFKLLQFLL